MLRSWCEKDVYKDLLTGHVDNELQRSEVPIQ